MALDFESIFVTSTGMFLPGPAIDNSRIEEFVAPLGTRGAGIKRRILADNGIATRHYAIDPQGNTVFSCTQMAAHAARTCLEASEVRLEQVSVLCTGSVGGDLAAPGFANMLQGELAAPPMHTSSHQGVCASGMAALQHAAAALTLGDHSHALVVASELPSRMFKRSRFVPREQAADYDAHFLRYMLSDGAGALLLSKQPRARGVSLRLDWVHSRSFSGDHPVCMQIGAASGQAASYLDYPSLAEAERAGAFLLRQDLRLLPRLFELGVHEYLELIRRERIIPASVDHFLCHYSSEKFAPIVQELMHKTGFEIPRERWYSNLRQRGNTGAASIFVMLDDFMRERQPQPGEQVLCFVPESGRFTVAFALLTVVAEDGGRAGIAAPHAPARERGNRAGIAQLTVVVEGGGRSGIAPPHAQTLERDDRAGIAPPHAPAPEQNPKLAELLGALAGVWHDYQSRLRRSRLLAAITRGAITREQYLAWMSAFIPQVRRGSHWMRTAAAHLSEPFLALQPLVAAHAQDEQNDYMILFDDYKCMGGSAPTIEALRRNPGGEALDAFMSALAERPNPIDLLGAIYIIEGTGQRVIPQMLPALRAQLRLPERAFRFLRYHGENDASHLGRWLAAVEIVLDHDTRGELHRAIVRTARATAELYLLQFDYLEDDHV
jgi:3-oxoacyl-[acyl-carrier-protein] synthase-3